MWGIVGVLPFIVGPKEKAINACLNTEDNSGEFPGVFNSGAKGNYYFGKK
jgi:hypothetical protein